MGVAQEKGAHRRWCLGVAQEKGAHRRRVQGSSTGEGCNQCQPHVVLLAMWAGHKLPHSPAICHRLCCIAPVLQHISGMVSLGMSLGCKTLTAHIAEQTCCSLCLMQLVHT